MQIIYILKSILMARHSHLLKYGLLSMGAKSLGFYILKMFTSPSNNELVQQTCVTE